MLTGQSKEPRNVQQAKELHSIARAVSQQRSVGHGAVERKHRTMRGAPQSGKEPGVM